MLFLNFIISGPYLALIVSEIRISFQKHEHRVLFWLWIEVVIRSAICKLWTCSSFSAKLYPDTIDSGCLKYKALVYLELTLTWVGNSQCVFLLNHFLFGRQADETSSFFYFALCWFGARVDYMLQPCCYTYSRRFNLTLQGPGSEPCSM